MGKNKNINSWLITGILVVFLVLFFGSREGKPLQSAATTVVTPFARFFSGTGLWFSEKIGFFSNIGELRNENENLSNENLKLKFQLAQSNEIANENKTLRGEIDLMDRPEFDLEASLVVGQTLSKNRKIIYLDKGSNQGIREGMPIIVGGGVLIGKINKVHGNSSEAELILDRKNIINAEIQEIETKGIVQGEYGTSAVIDMVPQAAEIETGQTVITSGLGGAYPRGLLVGYVKDVSLSVDQLFQRASLELPIEFKNLRIVWVIKDN